VCVSARSRACDVVRGCTLCDNHNLLNHNPRPCLKFMPPITRPTPVAALFFLFYDGIFGGLSSVTSSSAGPLGNLASAVSNVGSFLFAFSQPCRVGVCVGLGLVVAVGIIAWLRHPPTSACSFCGPCWYMAYSLPIALIFGLDEARSEFIAFTPVPDMILLAPLHCCSAEECEDCSTGCTRSMGCVGCPLFACGEV